MIFTFKWQNSDSVVAAIPARSRRQAEYLLGKQRGQAWTADALETGRIYLDKVEKPRPAAKKPWYAAPRHTVEEIGECWWNK